MGTIWLRLNNRRMIWRRFNARGFALIDSVLAALLLVIMATSLQSLFEVSREGIRFSNELDSADRDIHTIMGKIRQLGVDYHWCNGAGTVDTTACSVSLLGTNPQAYYSPDNLALFKGTNNSDDTSKDTGCQFDAEGDFTRDKILSNGDGNGNTGLLGALRQIRDNPSANLNVQINYTQDNKENRRIKVTLSKFLSQRGKTLTRQFYFAPMLALWCP